MGFYISFLHVETFVIENNPELSKKYQLSKITEKPKL